MHSEKCVSICRSDVINIIPINKLYYNNIMRFKQLFFGSLFLAISSIFTISISAQKNDMHGIQVLDKTNKQCDFKITTLKNGVYNIRTKCNALFDLKVPNNAGEQSRLSHFNEFVYLKRIGDAYLICSENDHNIVLEANGGANLSAQIHAARYDKKKKNQLWFIERKNQFVVFHNVENTGLCLDVPSGNAYHDAPLQLWHTNNQFPEQWTINEPVIDGYYTLNSKCNSNYAISMIPNKDNRVRLERPLPTNTVYIQRDGNAYLVKNTKEDDIGLSILNDNMNNKTLLHREILSDKWTQRWIIKEPSSFGWFSIASKQNPYYVVDLPDGNTKYPLEIYQVLKNDHQQWKFVQGKKNKSKTLKYVDVLDGYYKISPSLNNNLSILLECIEGRRMKLTSEDTYVYIKKEGNAYKIYGNHNTDWTSDASGEAGNGRVVYTYHKMDLSWQKWKIIKEKGSYVFISADNTCYAMDIPGANAVEGAELQVYESNHSDAQHWKLQRIGDSKVFVGRQGKFVSGKHCFVNENGDLYDGEWKDGMYNGQGYLLYADGNYYKGAFVEGKRSGYGILQCTNGDRYEGNFLNDRENGELNCYYADGTFYKGNWVDGDWTHGTYKNQVGTTFTGDWSDRWHCGIGTIQYTDGTKYEGSWRDYNRNGNGKLYRNDGSIYEGIWSGDGNSGDGTVSYPDKSGYKGTWQNLERSGKGVLTTADGYIYESEFWKENTINASAKITYADGNKYEGDVVNMIPNGQGVMNMANGDKYTGRFVNGKAEGDFRLTTTQGVTTEIFDGKRSIGDDEWAEGHFVNNVIQEPARYTTSNGTNIYGRKISKGVYTGQGTVVLSDGKRIEGDIEGNLINGQGKIFFTDGSWYEGSISRNTLSGHGIQHLANGESYDGDWVNNKLKGNVIHNLSDGSQDAELWENGKNITYRDEFAKGVTEVENLLSKANSLMRSGNYNKAREITNEATLIMDRIKDYQYKNPNIYTPSMQARRKKISELCDLILTKCASAQTSNLLTRGKFTVNAKGKKVQFTKGNLYWDGSAYHFEANQNDYPTSWDANHVGHFFWTTKASASYAEKYNVPNESESDVPFFAQSKGGLTVDGTSGLFALSDAEWEYLLETRPKATNLCKYGVTVGSNKNCLIIAPEGFAGTLKSSYTLSEIEAFGLVCLPAAGGRDDSDFSYSSVYTDCKGYYWSSTPSSYISCWAYFLNFYYDEFNPAAGSNRDCGRSVRLVRLAQ